MRSQFGSRRGHRDSAGLLEALRVSLNLREGSQEVDIALLVRSLEQGGGSAGWRDRKTRRIEGRARVCAVSRTSVSTPGGLTPFAGLNRGKPAERMVRPFNFLLVCFPDRVQGLPPGVDETRFRLVAPYERDTARWVRGQWWEAHTGERFRITTYGMGGDGVVRVKTYGEVIEAYRVHEEAKSVGPDGQPCGKKTRGLLGRRSVAMLNGGKHIGKESNRLEERMNEELNAERDILERVRRAQMWVRVRPAANRASSIRQSGAQAARLPSS